MPSGGEYMRSLADMPAAGPAMEFVCTASANVPSFLRHLLLRANALIGADIGFVGMLVTGHGSEPEVVWDPERDTIGRAGTEWTRYVGRLGVGGDNLPPGARSFVGYVAYSRQSRLSRNVLDDPYYKAANDEILSELAVPVVCDDELIAVLNLESKTSCYFTEAHQQLLETVAQCAGAALRDSNVSELRLQTLPNILTNITRLLGSVSFGIPLERNPVLDEVASIIAAALNCGLCSIWLCGDSSTPSIRGQYVRPESRNEATQLECGKFVAESVLHRAEALICGRSYEFGGQSHQRKVEPYNAGPMIGVPIVVRDEVIGALVVGLPLVSASIRLTSFGPSDQQMLQVIQGTLATFLYEKHLELERFSRLSTRARQLSEVSRIFADLDVNRMLERVVLKIPDLCGAKYCSIFLWNDERRSFVLAASKGLSTDQIGTASYDPGEELTGWVGLHGRVLVLDQQTLPSLRTLAPDLHWKVKYSEITDDSGIRHPFAAAPIFKGGRIYGVLRVSDRESGSFTEVDGFFLTLVAGLICSALECSDLYQEEVRVLGALRELLSYTRTLTAVDRYSEAFAPQTLNRIVLLAAQAFLADAVVLYRVQEGSIGEAPVHTGVNEPAFLDLSASSRDLPNLLIAAKRAEFWPEVRSEPLLMRKPLNQGNEEMERFAEREHIFSAAAVPLLVGDEVAGIMFINYRTPQHFSAHRRELMQDFASQAALSLELASLYDEIWESASREEALQIGFEIHDIKNAILAGIHWRAVSALKQCATGNIDEVATKLRAISRCALDRMRDLSSITDELQKSIVQPGNLVTKLSSLVDDIAPEGIRVAWHSEGVPLLLPKAARLLYLIAQEAINNAIKYSEATAISVSLVSKMHGITLRVSDNGCGFDLTMAMAGDSLGLKSMQQRAAWLGGVLNIDSHPAAGTTVVLELPAQVGQSSIE
jgi:signal transduction histidine kinase